MLPQGRLCSFHFEIKSSPAFQEGGGGFAQSLATAERGGEAGSKVDGQASAGTQSGTAGFRAARGRDAARSSLADRAGAPEQPAGRARARPPRSAPALGAALCASGPSPRCPAWGPCSLPALERSQAEPCRKLLTLG